MKIKSVRCVCFSPTGTTRTIAENIVQGIRPERIEMVDITKRSQRNGQPLLVKDDIVILTTPVYYGRVPEEMVISTCFFDGPLRANKSVYVIWDFYYDCSNFIW